MRATPFIACKLISDERMMRLIELTDDNLLVIPFPMLLLAAFRAVACFLRAHTDISILLFRFPFTQSLSLTTSVFVVLFDEIVFFFCSLH